LGNQQVGFMDGHFWVSFIPTPFALHLQEMVGYPTGRLHGRALLGIFHSYTLRPPPTGDGWVHNRSASWTGTFGYLSGIPIPFALHLQEMVGYPTDRLHGRALLGIVLSSLSPSPSTYSIDGCVPNR